jgi:hypothetical protein
VREEKYERNGYPTRRQRVLALVIILPVVLLVVIPGFLLIFSLGRAAGRQAPKPGDAAPIRRPSPSSQIAGQLQLFGSRAVISRRAANVGNN